MRFPSSWLGRKVKDVDLWTSHQSSRIAAVRRDKACPTYKHLRHANKLAVHWTGSRCWLPTWRAQSDTNHLWWVGRVYARRLRYADGELHYSASDCCWVYYLDTWGVGTSSVVQMFKMLYQQSYVDKMSGLINQFRFHTCLSFVNELRFLDQHISIQPSSTIGNDMIFKPYIFKILLFRGSKRHWPHRALLPKSFINFR